VFRALADLQVAIKRFLAEAESNVDPKPFLVTADPDNILTDADSRRAT
jgi:hypothetical protein